MAAGLVHDELGFMRINRVEEKLRPAAERARPIPEVRARDWWVGEQLKMGVVEGRISTQETLVGHDEKASRMVGATLGIHTAGVGG